MRRKISLGINAFIAVSVPAAWLYMVMVRGGILSSTGLSSLRYFTVLSNLLMGLASLIWLIFALRRGEMPEWVRCLKFTGAVAVSLTITTVFVFLGPLFGFGGMFYGANLFFHLLVPVAAIADCGFFDTERKIPMKYTYIAVIPMLIYGTVYYANILINGKSEGMNTNDWYGFAGGGPASAALAFLVILLANWVIACAGLHLTCGNATCVYLSKLAVSGECPARCPAGFGALAPIALFYWVALCAIRRIMMVSISGIRLLR